MAWTNTLTACACAALVVHGHHAGWGTARSIAAGFALGFVIGLVEALVKRVRGA